MAFAISGSDAIEFFLSFMKDEFEVPPMPVTRRTSRLEYKKKVTAKPEQPCCRVFGTKSGIGFMCAG